MLPSRYTGHERTFSLDDGVPKLPLPLVADTLQRYRALALPFCESAQEVQRLDALLHDARADLDVAQAELVKRHAATDNYIDEWWRIHAYLTDRAPIVPQESSTGDFSTEWTQTERAALIMVAANQVHARLAQETYPIAGPQPHEHWSMHQFRPVFEACRIPGVGCDAHSVNFKTTKERPLFQGHFVVACHGRLYTVPSQLALPDMLAAVEDIARDAHAPVRPGEFHSVGYLTAAHRDAWARARSRLVSDDARNLAVLHAVETALAMVTLDDVSLDCLDDIIARLSLPLDAGSRWFDKCTQFVVFRNGRSGHSMEHSLYDAASQFQIVGRDVGSVVRGFTAPLPPRSARCTAWARLDWGRVSPAARAMLANATAEYRRRHANAWTIRTACMRGVGKASLRALGQSPDSVLQMAFQCAWASLHEGRLPSVYESVQMLRFRRGRTEAGRCASAASKALIAALRGGQRDKVPQLLREACRVHAAMIKDHGQGRGVDRHLMALRLQLAELKRPAPAFMSDALWRRASAWDLSTSASFCETDLGINATSFRPVGAHSLGVVYALHDDHLDLTVLALNERADVDCDAFVSAFSSTLASFVAALLPGQSRV